MAWTPKPGSGALDKNGRKEKDSHPDWRGVVTTPDGQTWELAGWDKTGKFGPSISIKASAPRERPQAAAHTEDPGADF